MIVAVVAGPFGTTDLLDPWERAVFWFMVVTISVLFGFLVRAVVFTLIPRNRRLAQEALVIALLVVLLSPTIWWIMQEFSEQTATRGPDLGLVVFYVFILAFSVIALRHLVPALDRRIAGQQPGVTVADAAEQAPEPRLTWRLDADMVGPILRLSGQDHHVQVATATGTQMLRMRLVDAISEMGPVEGYCTHRSHWVTRAAIARIDRENSQKIWIVLTNGDRVPVSRKYRPDLEEAGIL